MDIQSPKFIEISFTKNDIRPPSSIITVSSDGAEIRQIPPKAEIAFKQVLRENSIIDFYV